jgi:hypothetical protein
MATATDLTTDLVAAIVALGVSTRGESDLVPTRDRLAAGATLYQLAVAYVARDEAIDSNVAYRVCDALVWFHHHLTDPTDERAYTQGLAWTLQDAITPSAWWTALASVFDLADGPELVEDVSREGDVISFALAARVRLAP